MGSDFAEVGPPKTDPPPRRRGGWWIRGWVLLVLLVVFTAATDRMVRSGSPGDVRQRPRVLTTLATITGPFVGAVARHGQSCCLDFSLWLAKISGPLLALGLIAQVIPLPRGWPQEGQAVFRVTAWTLGWLAWLISGQVSFIHAFS